MALEVAQFEAKEGKELEFEASVASAESLLKAAKGYIGTRLSRSVEKPSRYWLIIEWETVECHTVDFAGSDGAKQLAALIGPHLAAPPRVEHLQPRWQAD